MWFVKETNPQSTPFKTIGIYQIINLFHLFLHEWTCLYLCVPIWRVRGREKGKGERAGGGKEIVAQGRHQRGRLELSGRGWNCSHRQNFFSSETSVLLLRPFNWSSQAHPDYHAYLLYFKSANCGCSSHPQHLHSQQHLHQCWMESWGIISEPSWQMKPSQLRRVRAIVWGHQHSNSRNQYFSNLVPCPLGNAGAS